MPYGLIYLRTLFFVFCSLLLLASCGKSDEELAMERVQYAQELIDNNALNQAKIALDSVHALYPREVAARRIAAYLSDTITYIEAQRTLAYSDSLLQPLLPQVDKVLKQFRYVKDERYERDGKYVHHLLRTQTNTNRCFLQCYVSDQRETCVKSYFYGDYKLNQQEIKLSAGESETAFMGSNHAFEAEGWHEILTLQEEAALQLLNFVSAHKAERIRLTLIGKTQYVYYLQKNEKEALEQTYLLGTLMRDIRQLEQNINVATRQIERFENKK